MGTDPKGPNPEIRSQVHCSALTQSWAMTCGPGRKIRTCQVPIFLLGSCPGKEEARSELRPASPPPTPHLAITVSARSETLGACGDRWQCPSKRGGIWAWDQAQPPPSLCHHLWATCSPCIQAPTAPAWECAEWEKLCTLSNGTFGAMAFMAQVLSDWGVEGGYGSFAGPYLQFPLI